jgi:hypothetical protein
MIRDINFQLGEGQIQTLLQLGHAKSRKEPQTYISYLNIFSRFRKDYSKLVKLVIDTTVEQFKGNTCQISEHSTKLQVTIVIIYDCTSLG